MQSMPVGRLIRILEENGWRVVENHDGVRTLAHKDHGKPRFLTVQGRDDSILAKGAVESILRRAGLRVGIEAGS